MQELICQYKQPKFATLIGFVNDSESSKCYIFSQFGQFLVLYSALKSTETDNPNQVGPFPRTCQSSAIARTWNFPHQTFVAKFLVNTIRKLFQNHFPYMLEGSQVQQEPK